MLWNRGKPFALCVVTSPRGSVQSVRWMGRFSAVGVVRTGGAVGAVSAGAGCSRYGGWGELSAVGAVDERE